MIGRERTPATRANLLRATRRQERVSRGIDLLRRKREALVRELVGLASPAVDARARIARRARRAYPLLLEALAVHGRDELRAMGWPARELRIRLRPIRIWGVEADALDETPAVVRTLEARGTAPPLTGPAASGAATEFERLVDELLEGASREILLRRLGEALSRTSRQVHALEHRLQPRLEAGIREIRRTLDEREREDHFRLKRHLEGGGNRAAVGAGGPGTRFGGRRTATGRESLPGGSPGRPRTPVGGG